MTIIDPLTNKPIPNIDEIDDGTMDLITDEIFDVFHKYGIRYFWFCADLRGDAMFFRGTIPPDWLFVKMDICKKIIQDRLVFNAQTGEVELKSDE